MEKYGKKYDKMKDLIQRNFKNNSKIYKKLLVVLK